MHSQDKSLTFDPMNTPVLMSPLHLPDLTEPGSTKKSDAEEDSLF